MKNPLEQTFRRFRGIAAAFLLAGAASLPWGEPGLIAGILLLILGGTFAIITGILAIYRRKFARHISALERGEFVAHWVYPPDLWQRFLDAEISRPPEAPLSTYLLIFGAFGVFLGGIFWFAGLRLQGTRWLMPAICVASGALLGALVSWLSAAMAQSRFRRLERSEPEAYIGREGLYFASNYTPWGMIGQSLESLVFREGDIPLLEFRFRVNAGETDHIDTIRVPVPPGEEPRAQGIAAALGGG